MSDEIRQIMEVVGEEEEQGQTLSPPQAGESVEKHQEGLTMTMPVMTAWEDGKGQIRFLGVASSTRRDKQGEKMTPRALEAMAGAKGLLLLPHHGAAPEEALGTVETGWTDGQSFRIAGTLRADSPPAWALVKSIQAGKSYGLSVGGRVTKAFWGYDATGPEPVRFIEGVELAHVAVCETEERVNESASLRVAEPTPRGSEAADPFLKGGVEAETARSTRAEDSPRSGQAAGRLPHPPGPVPRTEQDVPPPPRVARGRAPGERGVGSTAPSVGTGATPVEAEGEAPPPGCADATTLPRAVADDRGGDGGEAEGGRTLGDDAQSPPLQPETEEEEAEPGRRRSLTLERSAARNGATVNENNIWRGVL